MVPNDLKYTDQHEWVKTEGAIATVGITDHAQKALGDITFVELPEAGRAIAKGDEACALESCKAAASIYAPVSGKVVDANQALEQQPGLINSDCYEAGWVFKLELTDPSELDKLMAADKYTQFLTEQQ